jgi:hypothetical protein
VSTILIVAEHLATCEIVPRRLKMRSLSELTDVELGRLTLEQIARSGENKAPVTIVVGVSLLTVALFFCLLRFYVRMRMTRNVGKDDWAVLAAMVRLTT